MVSAPGCSALLLPSSQPWLLSPTDSRASEDVHEIPQLGHQPRLALALGG